MMKKAQLYLETIKWVLLIGFLCSGLFAHYYFTQVAWEWHLLASILLITLLATIFLMTSQGKSFWQFAKMARIELYKIVWPKREEVVKITLMVAVLVVVMSIVLWFLDSLLLKIISWLIK